MICWTAKYAQALSAINPDDCIGKILLCLCEVGLSRGKAANVKGVPQAMNSCIE
jgi:hypothetical protein|tara:strand:+ start:1796 stop:1957 length:162 start_codon:yes stop_codon:yes gene_type:complete